MTGEVKGARSKKCLSRNKRSKPGKSTENDHCSDEAPSGTYTAVRSRQPAHSNEKSNDLENLVVESTEDATRVSGNYLKSKPAAGTSRDRKNDAFDFCDDDDEAIDDDVDESRCIDKSCSNKRKRIDSEELEPSGFTNVVSKFKRSRKALNNLKQPSVCLEKCKDVSADSKSQSKRTDKSIERNKKGVCTKTLSTTEGSLGQLHKVDVITDETLSPVGDQKQNLNSGNQHKVGSICEGNIVDDSKWPDDEGDYSQNQVCPVCSFKFLPTDKMDVINKHINRCLDGGSGSSNRENVSLDAACGSIGEDLFFCQLCQKDLSRMNSQRRQQHINRCCDQAGKAEEMPPLNTVPAQLQCPICGKGFKSSKSRQTHLKKCAQDYNVGTNQLLEIVHRERQQEESSTLAAVSQVNTVSSTNSHPAQSSSGVKKKRRGVKSERDLDEETQLALALSASMAPPPPPVTNVGKGVKGKGKKNKGGSELPALLLRDDETAQRAMALRAAQVLCTQEGNDEDDEISCTPALAPSRLAQNIPDYQTVDPVKKEMESEHFADDIDSKVDNATKSDREVDEDNLMDVDSGNESDKDKEGSKKSMQCTVVVDPLLSRSFLNSLYEDEVEESQPVEIKAPCPSHLWSLAAAKDQSSALFYVPGLLPPAAPRRSPKLPKQFTASESSVKENNVHNELHEQVVDHAITKEVSSHATSEMTGEPVAQLQMSTSEIDECPEITPTQAANVQILLELAGEDDVSNISMDSQQMIAASGFWVDEQEKEEKDKESDTLPSGVSKLLQDLSSMINNSYLSDVVIYLKDGKKMAAHSFILSLRSEVLAQLLKERAVQKETVSDGRTDPVFLKFEEIDQSAFEVVLKHIYTGDVIIPEDCELDDVTNLAERFKLPCLLNACKKTQSRLKQVLESQEDDETDNCIATDVEKLEEDLWKSDNDDDFREDFQTSKDKEDEDDFLNDDDIEEIMIFQTQSLQRKGSESRESGREEFEEKSRYIPSLDIREEISATDNNQVTFGDDLPYNESSFPTSEKTEQKLGKLNDDGSLPRCPIEESNVSRNRLEKDDLSRSPVDEDSVSRNPVEESNLSRNPGKNDGSSAEKEEGNVKLILSCVKENIVGEDVLIEKEQLSLREESVRREQLRNERDDCEKNQVLSSDDKVISRSCVQDGGPISDSDDIEAQPEDHMQEISKRRTLERDLEQSCGIGECLSPLEEDVEHDFELENDADCTHIYNVSADLLNDENEVDVKEKDVSGEIQDTLSDFKPDKSKNLDHVENNNEVADETLSLPSGEERCDDEEVFQGSPGDVTVPDDVESDYEMEEMAPNESITLISDNEEEVLDLDVSPPQTDITIVPETPCVRGRISTKSSSTLSVSEDNVSVTGSSPSKSRKQLNEEANEFLAKLKQRAGRGKGKKESKKSGGTKKSPVESSTKQRTPTKNSPLKNQDAQVGMTSLSSNIRTSCLDSESFSASPMRMSPRGCKSPSDSPTRMKPRSCNSPSLVTMQTSPRGCKSPSGSPMQTSPRSNKSPRGLNPRNISPIVPDVVTIGNSPPVSPVLLQPHDSPHNSQTKKKGEENIADLCGRKTLGERGADFGEPSDVEIVETCADKSEGGIYGDLALSTTSSPRDVMSPPVPSPSYSFLEHVSPPGSPVFYASPPSQKIALSPDPVSPILPVDWKFPALERRLDACPQSNSPVSPSVCSYSSQIARGPCSQDGKKNLVKNLEKNFEESCNDKEKPRSIEVVEIDPNVPLMERLKAARGGGGHKIFSLGKDEDNSDTNSDDCGTKNEVRGDEKESPMVSSQPEKATNSQHEVNEMENISMGADFDFHDDGGFNFDIDELNNLEGCFEDDSNVKAKEGGHSKEEENEDKVMPQKKGSKAVAGKRKIPPSQRRVQDSDDDDDMPQEAPPKRGKKTDTQSRKATGQTVKQPVTPMPNYNEMATPVLKGELNKFGVRPLPKKKMILKLKEIYDYTHQVEPRPQESKTERAPSKGQPLSSNVEVSDAADRVEGSGTASSDNSDEEDTEFGDCTVMIEDDVITASQQVNGGNLKERLISYVRDNEELYSKILQFQPQELVSLQQQIKSDGINCPLGKLVDFLDQQCITFTTAGSRPRASRKRGRKRKGDNAKPSK